MMLSPNLRSLAFGLTAGVVALLLAPQGSAQEEPLFVATGSVPDEASPAGPEKAARALLDDLKKSERERQIAVKQTEIDRIKQDQEKTEGDAASVQKSIDSMAALINGSGEELTKLTAESRRLEHELAVAEARMAAERLKTEGLRALSAAQGKVLSTLARHAEESEARARLRAAELALLKEGKAIPADSREESSQSEFGKCRKALQVAEAKTAAEEKAAREAMKAATDKMALADAKESTAKRLADNDLTLPPIAEKTKAKSPERTAEKKESDPPARKSPSATAASAPKPTTKPATATRTSTTNPPPRGPFFGR